MIGQDLYGYHLQVKTEGDNWVIKTDAHVPDQISFGTFLFIYLFTYLGLKSKVCFV